MNKSKLKTARISRGWTQYELAMRSGVSRPTISLLERGVTTGTLRTLTRLSDALGVSVKSLFCARND